MRVLLLTPPMTQLNTPYPATSYLTGFLRERGHDARQVDLSLALALRWLSREGLTEVASQVAGHPARFSHASVAHFLEHEDAIVRERLELRFLQAGPHGAHDVRVARVRTAHRSSALVCIPRIRFAFSW